MKPSFISLNLTNMYREFFDSEKAGGLILIICTVISLILANSPLQAPYLEFWQIDMAGHSIGHWINDGLMAVFFLLIGLELEREIYAGELSDLKSAALPFFGAIGGMVAPAGLFLLLNFGKDSQAGAGISMATDIAFAIGILSLLGSRVPLSLKVFLTALAVMDDLGAILVIAIFYTQSLSLESLTIAIGIFGILLLLNRLRVHNLIPYMVGGVVMWYFMLHSGIHATIAGVLLAFAVPFSDGGEKSPSLLLQHFLHKPVAFIIVPLFALANTGIILSTGWTSTLSHSNSLGIFLGLIVGKPMGITLFAFIGAWLGLCALPTDLNWKHIIGAGFLGGIGFTMSIFITLLAYDQPAMIDGSKIAVLIASFIAGIIGFLWLRATLKTVPKEIPSG